MPGVLPADRTEDLIGTCKGNLMVKWHDYMYSSAQKLQQCDGLLNMETGISLAAWKSARMQVIGPGALVLQTNAARMARSDLQTGIEAYNARVYRYNAYLDTYQRLVLVQWQTKQDIMFRLEIYPGSIANGCIANLEHLSQICNKLKPPDEAWSPNGISPRFIQLLDTYKASAISKVNELVKSQVEKQIELAERLQVQITAYKVHLERRKPMETLETRNRGPIRSVDVFYAYWNVQDSASRIYNTIAELAQQYDCLAVANKGITPSCQSLVLDKCEAIRTRYLKIVWRDMKTVLGARIKSPTLVPYCFPRGAATTQTMPGSFPTAITDENQNKDIADRVTRAEKAILHAFLPFDADVEKYVESHKRAQREHEPGPFDMAGEQLKEVCGILRGEVKNSREPIHRNLTVEENAYHACAPSLEHLKRAFLT